MTDLPTPEDLEIDAYYQAELEKKQNGLAPRKSKLSDRQNEAYDLMKARYPDQSIEFIWSKAEQYLAPRLFPTLSVEKLTAKLGPIPWVCEPLRLAPGFPSLVAGYGFAGKTVSCQQLLLAHASGGRGFGIHSMRRQAGRCMHLDWDQGERTTIERYQRLAHDSGVNLAEVVRGGFLGVASLPPVFLTDPRVESELSFVLEGVDLCLMDSLTSALPGVDENSTAIAAYLYMLGRVSGRTGCTIIMLHHYRKGKEGDKEDDPAQRIRGNGAIFNACAVAYGLSAKRGEPTRWQCVKQRHTGVLVEDFYTKVTDTGEVLEMGQPSQGLCVQLVGDNEAETVLAKVRKLDKRRQKTERDIIDAIRAGTLRSFNDVYDIVGGDRNFTNVRFREMTENGRILSMGGVLKVGTFDPSEPQPV